jgi:hypothetical protein
MEKSSCRDSCGASNIDVAFHRIHHSSNVSVLI